MRLTRLTVRGFRNLAPTELTTDTRFVVLSGANAQGKTNTLEAVHLLATLKPLHGRGVRDLVQWGSDQAIVRGVVHHDGLDRDHGVDLTTSGRTARLDDKPVSDLVTYFGSIRAIAFTPRDAAIVVGEPSRRRNWLDRAAFTARPAHLVLARQVRRCLRQKSAALRSEHRDRALLDVLDVQLAQVSAVLVQRRVELLEELAPHIERVHTHIAGGCGSLSLSYRTHATGDTVKARTEALLERLAVVRDRELDRRTTLAGPQLDDVRIHLDDRRARTFGSRGQVRSIVLALKLAELQAARSRGERPLFLIDDVSSELDRARTARLVESLADLGAQVWATTTDPDHLGILPADDTRFLTVRGGAVSEA